MTASNPERRRSRKELAFRLVGFAAGLALLAWCVHRAFAGDGAATTWGKLRSAPPWALWGLGLSSLGSLLVNSAMFWCLIRPVRPVGIGEMTGLNLVASMLNYLPIPLRLGMVARIAYHVRVNRMGAVAVAGYFGAVILVTLIVFGGLAVTVVLYPPAGTAVASLAGAAAIVAGAVATAALARWTFIARRVRGAEQVLADRTALAGGIACRVADTLLWAVRMTCAVTVLGLPLSAGESALLGLVAIAMSMNPLGRFGFREAGVVWASGYLFAGRMGPEGLQQAFAQLAVVESAAEGAVTLPLGAVMLPWFLGRMRKASPRPSDGAAEAVVEGEVPKP